MYSHPNLLKLRSDVSKFCPALLITGIYLTISIIWILWSDALAEKLAHNNSALLVELQNQKGIAFVLLSSLLLFMISHSLYKRLRHSNKSKTTLEQKFEALNVAARGGMIDYDTETKTAIINEKMSFFMPGGRQRIENFFQRFLERIHKADIARVRSEFEMANETGQNVWTTEYRLLGVDGIYYSVLSSLFLIRDTETNKTHRLIGEIQDITQLRNLQAEYYNQQLKHKQRLASTIIKAQENERNRWAEELHDNVSQLLTVVNLYLSNTEVIKEKNISMISKAKQMVTEAQQEIRMLSATIKPPQFSLMTLQQSIEKLIADINRVKNISIVLITTDFNESELKDEQLLMIYRIVQEQLNNIIKYAEATQIKITLQTKNDEVGIVIYDDGNGFDKNQMKTGLGFRNIQSRLQLYNGQMDVESAAGKGCKLSVSFHI
ncbi:sensor histidine kinase [Lacibacter sp.]|uniref:sensor histidine kinase n=1 Tax=Lacibacter sp. TaxID=1915409 RepID=UPI002B4AB357|nr:sensor histidine kinase [Lacibacter sp.]HLP35616.1 sensor histidine kinase [Lacibacter sp.]